MYAIRSYYGLLKVATALLLGGATYAFALTADEVKAHVMEGKSYNFV